MRCFARLAVVLAVVAGLACGFTSKEDEWVARVDDALIEISELRRAVEPRFTDEPDSPHEEIALQELDRLVNETIILNRARVLSVHISDADLARRLETLLGSKDQAADADASYQTLVRRQMLLDRTALADLADKIQVSESGMLHHFEANGDRYAEPPRVSIRQIVVEEESKARQLLSELRNGADFENLARAHSLSPDAQQGGILPPFGKGELPLVFDRAFEIKPGKLSDVFESPYGFHIFRVEERIAASKPDFESARQRIREELESTRMEELRREWLVALRREAEIEVNETALEQLQ